ncbi:DUF4163 domain-containing protein [Methylobacterium sp. J-088]|uniref:DUF4163 domain-containing protein n=1 Tax=Methylobacterium sp. J-088 TaxID=2836664 RepID=UPI001FB88F4B|nr:DUF4163 domain-containing protein [Methylobacterium sp. J-088]MCJ2063863.1 DUF4163 domain-containing protein [Methylobacterium sp. J-088]
MKRNPRSTASRGGRAAIRHGACAVLLAMAAPAWAADRTVTLKAQPEAKADIAVMPQIDAPVDEAERRINTALKRLDGNVRKAAKQCTVGDGKPGDWGRSVETSMRGPSFVSFVIHDDSFCGGAHPNSSTMSIVYDLTTGAPVDWTKLLPPSLIGTVALAEGMDGTKMVTLASKRLHRLYLERYRPKAGDPKKDDADKECRESVTETFSGDPPAMMAWLDAKEGGLAVQFDLAHAVQACADAVVIPNAVLRREGAKPILVDALDAARAAGQ